MKEAMADREGQRARQAKPDANAKIPDDFEKMGVKDLKILLDKLNIRRDDCFEKGDMINRLKEFKANKNKPPPSSGA